MKAELYLIAAVVMIVMLFSSNDSNAVDHVVSSGEYVQVETDAEREHKEKVLDSIRLCANRYLTCTTMTSNKAIQNECRERMNRCLESSVKQ